jgi:hypothetical protein
MDLHNMDITTVDTKTLKENYYESERDIHICEVALENGVTKYSGGLVQERLDVNKKIAERIKTELKRRGQCT